MRLGKPPTATGSHECLHVSGADPCEAPHLDAGEPPLVEPLPNRRLTAREHARSRVDPSAFSLRSAPIRSLYPGTVRAGGGVHRGASKRPHSPGPATSTITRPPSAERADLSRHAFGTDRVGKSRPIGVPGALGHRHGCCKSAPNRVDGWVSRRRGGHRWPSRLVAKRTAAAAKCGSHSGDEPPRQEALRKRPILSPVAECVGGSTREASW